VEVNNGRSELAGWQFTYSAIISSIPLWRRKSDLCSVAAERYRRWYGPRWREAWRDSRCPVTSQTHARYRRREPWLWTTKTLHRRSLGGKCRLHQTTL